MKKQTGNQYEVFKEQNEILPETRMNYNTSKLQTPEESEINRFCDKLTRSGYREVRHSFASWFYKP